jgi:hypothetical protein
VFIESLPDHAARVNFIRTACLGCLGLSLGLSLSLGCIGEHGSTNPTPPTTIDPVQPEPVDPIIVELAAPQVRVLSAPEYRNTVRDLLGLSVSTNLMQSDWTAGFDNGAGILVDENLLSALLTEAETLAAEYVATRAAADFPCFNVDNIDNIDDACMRTLIEGLGRRAYRRPLSDEQKSELFAFFSAVSTEASSRSLGAEMVVARMLTSPQLLYRSEVGQPTTPGGDLYQLDAFEKASLVAYTLTGTMPDEPLLADAEAGGLDDAGLRGHIQRLWAAPQTRERVGDFFRQWLKATRLDEMARRPEDYPKLTTPALGASLKSEFDAFVAAVVFDGAGTLSALFTESFTMADVHTAPLYGLETTSESPTRLELDPSSRQGVLTLASTMAAIASHDDAERDRPVLRGLMVMEQLLCGEVGPPSGINTIAAMEAARDIPNFDELTTREQFEAMMMQSEDCLGCHTQFMPYGFALGSYDALGRYRTEHHGRPIDTAVHDVPFGDEVRSFADGPDLASSIATSPTAAACFSTHFASFTTGAVHGPHTETLGGAVQQKLGDEPIEIKRFVEEMLATPELYQRRAVLVPDTGPPPGDTDGGVVVVERERLLASGATLSGDASVTSMDGAFRLVYQLDGNLVLYRESGGAPWASGTSGTSVGQTSMQGDGNLVVYDADGVPRFASGTDGNPGAELYIDTEGTLTIVGTNDETLWTTATGGTP